MNSISHGGGTLQVRLSTQSGESKPKLPFSYEISISQTKTQTKALELYEMGLNVFPQPIGKKGGYPWKTLQYTRLSNYDDLYSVESLFSGECNVAVMCGRTSGNLFVIDCESRRTLTYHIEQCRSRGIPLWVVKTARGGHIYMRCLNGEVENIPGDMMYDVEIRGNSGYVLAPPSIHPSGDEYKWMMREGDEIPVVRIEDIDWLRDRSGNRIELKANKSAVGYMPGQWLEPNRTKADNLSKQTRDYIASGGSIPEGTRNNRLFRAACDMLGNGYSVEHVTSILAPIAMASGLPSREVHATLGSAASQPRTPSRPINNQKPKRIYHEEWFYVLNWLIDNPRKGRTAASDRAVILALVERLRTSTNKNNLFRASIREIADLSRLSTTTVQKCLKRLIREKVIQKCGSDRMSDATVWSFCAEITEESKTKELQGATLSLPPQWLRYSVSLFNSEMSEKKVIGHSVLFFLIHFFILDQPMMPSALAKATGLTIGQVNYAIRKLRDLGILTRIEEGWSIDHGAFRSLDEQSANFQRGPRRRQRHDRERRLYTARRLYSSRYYYERKAFFGPLRLETLRQQYVSEAVEILKDPALRFVIDFGGHLRLDEGVHLYKSTNASSPSD